MLKDDETLEKNGTLVSFRVAPEMASAMATVARKELLTKSCVARRALAEDLRRRGVLEEAEA